MMFYIILLLIDISYLVAIYGIDEFKRHGYFGDDLL